LTANQRFHANYTNQGLRPKASLITKALLRNHAKSTLVERITQHWFYRVHQWFSAFCFQRPIVQPSLT